jgi:hypothetical protein
MFSFFQKPGSMSWFFKYFRQKISVFNSYYCNLGRQKNDQNIGVFVGANFIPRCQLYLWVQNLFLKMFLSPTGKVSRTHSSRRRREYGTAATVAGSTSTSTGPRCRSTPPTPPRRSSFKSGGGKTEEKISGKKIKKTFSTEKIVFFGSPLYPPSNCNDPHTVPDVHTITIFVFHPTLFNGKRNDVIKRCFLLFLWNCVATSTPATMRSVKKMNTRQEGRVLSEKIC